MSKRREGENGCGGRKNEEGQRGMLDSHLQTYTSEGASFFFSHPHICKHFSCQHEDKLHTETQLKE